MLQFDFWFKFLKSICFYEMYILLKQMDLYFSIVIFAKDEKEIFYI